MLARSSFLFSRTIGEGGFGRVSAEIYLGDEKWYALKEIKKSGLLKHKTGLSMLFGELNALQKADHTFLVKLHYAFHDPRSCFLVFDLKTGGDLRFFLRHKKAFDERTLAFFIGCLTSALAYLHRRRVIHRDVKPENIILDQHGWPHLTDFGVAYVEPRDHPAGLPLSCCLASGTKQYLAPEVFTKGHVHGPESDFWALGVVLFELMFFRRPFEKHVPVAFINYLELCHQQQASAMGGHSRCNSISSTVTGSSPNKSRRLGRTNENCNAASTAVVSGMNTAFSPAPSPHGSSSRASFSSRFSPARHSSKAPSPSPTSAYFQRASPALGEYDCPMPPQSVVAGSFRSCSAARGIGVAAVAAVSGSGGVSGRGHPLKHPVVDVDVDEHELVLINDRFSKVEVGLRGPSPSDMPTKLQGVSPCSPAPSQGSHSSCPTPTPFSPKNGCSINDSVLVAFGHASGAVVAGSPAARRGLLAPLGGSPGVLSPCGGGGGSGHSSARHSPSAFPDSVGSPCAAGGVEGIARVPPKSPSVLMARVGTPTACGRRDTNFLEAKDKFDCGDCAGGLRCSVDEDQLTENPDPSPLAFLQLPSHLRVPVPMYNALLTKVSLQCANIIEGLLDLRPECRLGAGRDCQVKNLRNHEWFSHFDWNVNKLEHRALGGVGGGGASAPDPTCDNHPPFNPHYWRKNLTYHVEDNFGGPVLSVSSVQPSAKEQREAEVDAKRNGSGRPLHSSLSEETQSLFEGFQFRAQHASTTVSTSGVHLGTAKPLLTKELGQANLLSVC